MSSSTRTSSSCWSAATPPSCRAQAVRPRTWMSPRRQPLTNLTRLTSALEHLDTRMRTNAVPEGLPFSTSAEAMRGLLMLNLTTKHGDLDIAFHPSGTGGYPDLIKNAEEPRPRHDPDRNPCRHRAIQGRSGARQGHRGAHRTLRAPAPRGGVATRHSIRTHLTGVTGRSPGAEPGHGSKAGGGSRRDLTRMARCRVRTDPEGIARGAAQSAEDAGPHACGLRVSGRWRVGLHVGHHPKPCRHDRSCDWRVCSLGLWRDGDRAHRGESTQAFVGGAPQPTRAGVSAQNPRYSTHRWLGSRVWLRRLVSFWAMVRAGSSSWMSNWIAAAEAPSRCG
jgi:hypothetical protein